MINTEMLCSRKCGSTFWMELDITPVLSDSNEELRYIAVGRDISQRKLNEQSVDEARNVDIQKREEARLLAEFSEWLQSSDSLDELYPIVSAYVSILMPATSGALYIYANSHDATMLPHVNMR